ncbi:MAG: hypothetical protein QXI02_06890 [Candidatus Caldarchaeum sp.]
MIVGNEKKIIAELAGRWADKYQDDHLRKREFFKEILMNNPLKGCGYFLHHSFARAGAERARYGEKAANALENVSKQKGYPNLMKRRDASEIVWNEFEALCKADNKEPYSDMNRGVIEGIISLVQQSEDFNPFKHLSNMLPDKVLDAYTEIMKIKGIGKKIAAMLLRDMVTILGIDDKSLPLHNQVFLQPIDRWVKEISLVVFFDGWKPTDVKKVTKHDWLIASVIVERCLNHGYSPSRFNQGAWKYGSSEIKNVNKTPDYIQKLNHEH